MHGDAGDALWLDDEGIPSVAAGIDDGFVGFVDAVAEVVLAEELPDVSNSVRYFPLNWSAPLRVDSVDELI